MFHVEQNKPLTVKDHLVSGNQFEIQWMPNENSACTFPQPSQEELPQYYASEEYVSHQSNSRSFVDVLYRIARHWMLRRKKSWIQPYLTSSSKVLDYGCGTGAFLDYLNSIGMDVCGVEPSEIARSNAPNHLMISSSLVEIEGSFDLISLWHVLEHVPDPSKTMNALQKRLNPEGVFAIALPNFCSWDAKHYRAFWAAWDVPRHLWHFSPKGIEQLMNELDFEKVSQRGMPLDAIYISYLSEKHKGNSIALLKGIVKGIYSNLKAFSSNNYSSQLYFFKRRN